MEKLIEYNGYVTNGGFIVYYNMVIVLFEQ